MTPDNIAMLDAMIARAEAACSRYRQVAAEQGLSPFVRHNRRVKLERMEAMLAELRAQGPGSSGETRKGAPKGGLVCGEQWIAPSPRSSCPTVTRASRTKASSCHEDRLLREEGRRPIAARHGNAHPRSSRSQGGRAAGAVLEPSCAHRSKYRRSDPEVGRKRGRSFQAAGNHRPAGRQHPSR